MATIEALQQFKGKFYQTAKELKGEIVFENSKHGKSVRLKDGATKDYAKVICSSSSEAELSRQKSRLRAAKAKSKRASLQAEDGRDDPSTTAGAEMPEATDDATMHELQSGQLDLGQVGAKSGLRGLLNCIEDEDASTSSITQVRCVRYQEFAWQRGFLPSSDPNVSPYMKMSCDELDVVLLENNQPLPSSKAEKVELCLNGVLNGVFPPCRCGARLSVDFEREAVVCEGKLEGRAFRVCPSVDQSVKTCAWKCPLFAPTQKSFDCSYSIIIKLNRKAGFYVDFEESRPTHWNCVCQARSTRDVAVRLGVAKMAPGAGETITDKQATRLSLSSNANFLSRSTLKRALGAKKVAAQVDQREGQFRLVNYIQELARLNPGSVVRMLTRTMEGILKQRSYSGESFEVGDVGKLSEFQDRERAFISEHTDALSLESSVEIAKAIQRLLHEKNQEIAGVKALWSNEKMMSGASVDNKLWSMRLHEVNQRYYPRIACKLEALCHAGSALQFNQPSEFETCDEELCVTASDAQTDQELLVALCIVPGPCVALAKKAAVNVFGIDGCHVKDGKKEPGTKGQILVCEGKDSLNKIFPLGYCFCFSESEYNLRFLIDAIGLAGLELNVPTNIIMSDRSKAAFSLMAKRMPFARHRWCEEHLIRNIRDSIRMPEEGAPAVVLLIRKACRALTKVKFNQAMLELNRSWLAAYNYLQKLDVNCWASYTFVEAKIPTHGIVTNNGPEEENNRLIPVRRMKTVLEGVVGFCNLVSGMFAERQKLVAGFDPKQFISPWTMSQIAKSDHRHGEFQVTASDFNNWIFTLRHYTASSILSGTVVRLKENLCECGEWQDRLYPCVHVMVVLKSLSKQDSKLVDPRNIYENYYGSMHRVEKLREALQNSFVAPSAENVCLGEFPIVRPGQDLLSEQRAKIGRPSKEARIASRGQI